MRQNQEVFFHVGLGKVASTYLQKEVFPKISGIHYIPTRQYKQSKKLIPKIDANKVLVSREFDRQFEEEVRWFTRDYPEAKVIVLFRRHDSWIASQYKRHVKNGFLGDFNEFLDLNQDQGYWKVKELDYQKKLEIIQECCTNPPLVLMYEDLVSDPPGFLKGITDYMGEPALEQFSTARVHASFSDKQLTILRSFCRKYIGRMPKNYSNKIKHWLLYRPVWALYHLLLYIAGLLPGRFAPKGPLINQALLDQISEAFSSDWEYVKMHSTKAPSQNINR